MYPTAEPKRWNIVWALALMVTACSAPAVQTVGGSGPGATDAAANAPPDAPFIFTPGAADAQTVSSAPDAPQQACAAESHKAEAVPVDVFMLLDASGSMDEQAGTMTKWEMVRQATASFIADPKSAGLNVGVEFFPLGMPCLTDADCAALLPGANLPPGSCNLPFLGLCTPPGGQPGNQFCPLGGGRAGGLCTKGSVCQPAPGVCAGSDFPCTNVGGMCTGIDAGSRCIKSSGTCIVDSPAQCASALYEKPELDFTALPAGAATATAALDQRAPGDGTPMQQAVEGALAHVAGYLGAHPGHRGVLVLATDGRPESDSCMQDTNAIVQAVTAAKAGTPPVSTYTIGVFGAMDLGMGQTLLDQMAAAGGTTKAFVLQPNADLTATFLAALEQIRGQVLPCQFTIPPPTSGALDYARVNVRFTGPAGTVDLGYVADAAHCDPTRGGWYYDVDPAKGGHPAQVLTCATTCAQLQADGKAQVELSFGCQTKVIN